MAYEQPTTAPRHGSSTTPTLRRPILAVAASRRRAVAEALEGAKRGPQRSEDRSEVPSRAQAGTGGDAAPWHIANYVSAQPGGRATRQIPSRVEVSGPSRMDELRTLRLRRRLRSSGWLIGGDRVAAGMSWNASDDVSANDAEWVRPPRPARCGWRIAADVGVHGGDGSIAHLSGVEQCGSVWACSCCSAIVRARYATEIQQAVQQHQASGGGVLFVTATLRHHRGHDLKTTLNAALEGWRRTLSGRPWTRLQSELGIGGVIRTVEITTNHGPTGNGWHPHVHALVFFDHAVTTSDVVAFDQFFFPRWADRVVKLGAGVPDRAHGLDLQVVDHDGRALAAYLAKVQDEGKSNVGAELARSDMKSGRDGSKTPFELLDADDDDVQARWLWWEYVTVTKGRKAVTWTDGLRERFDLAPEQTPEEILEAEAVAEYQFSIEGERFDAIRADVDRISFVLRAVEAGRVDLAEAAVWAVWVGDYLCDPVTWEVLHQVE